MLCEFLNIPCSMQFDRYRSTRNLAVQLVIHNPDGAIENYFHNEPMTVATVNLGPLPDDRIAIKDYSENEGMVKSLAAAGFIEPSPCETVDSGFVRIPVHKLTPAAIDEFRAAGVIQ